MGGDGRGKPCTPSFLRLFLSFNRAGPFEPFFWLTAARGFGILPRWTLPLEQTLTEKNSQTVDFEKSLTELETLVNTLEKGDLSLEDSLKTFEKGIQLTQSCQNALKQAEQRVQVLMQGKDGELELQDMDAE
ncbi:MAG: exodeoxyribonuclease VII small subunit [Cellvibrionaceae bacterium]|nr:exodeoxyribonuclease VII small subunit [Cellvibrionaceae bacterium]